MVNTIRDFVDGDRYRWDFGLCSSKHGFAQVDTSQDASYFGTWTNPERRMVVTFCEGDVTLQTADTDTEYVALLRHIKAWNEENGHAFLGIDPMGSGAIETKLRGLGLGDLLH